VTSFTSIALEILNEGRKNRKIIKKSNTGQHTKLIAPNSKQTAFNIKSFRAKYLAR